MSIEDYALKIELLITRTDVLASTIEALLEDSNMVLRVGKLSEAASH